MDFFVLYLKQARCESKLGVNIAKLRIPVKISLHKASEIIEWNTERKTEIKRMRQRKRQRNKERKKERQQEMKKERKKDRKR